MENTIIPNIIYLPFENVVDINPDYEKYIENYREINQKNLISSIFNKYVAKIMKINMIITKISLWLVPIMGVITFIIYIIVNKKINKEKVKVIQLANILYATSFGGIMAYIVFGTTVDRYVVPMIIPAFIAHFLFVIIIKYFIEYLEKIISEKDKATKNY